MIHSMKTELMRRQVRDNLLILVVFGFLILLQKSVSSWHLLNDDLERQAAALTLTLKPALQFNDKKEAYSSLSILRRSETIVHARVTRPDQSEFARYTRDGDAGTDAVMGLTWHSYTRSFPLLDEGENIGTLTLERHLDDIYQGLLFYTVIVFAMGLLVWFASLVFARSVHEKFSASFDHMIRMMQSMQDGSRRAAERPLAGAASFAEVQFILQEFQKMTIAIAERDERLTAANSELEHKVMERTRELEALQERLVEEAHKAGMADVASSVLHNFGNVLSSISIDCSILREMIMGTEPLASFQKIMENLDDPQKLTEILGQPSKMESLRLLFRELDQAALEERAKYREIADRMNEQLHMMKDLIYYQQNYATGQALVQTVGLRDILEQAFNIKLSLLKASAVHYSISVTEDVPVIVQKTKLLHVFANLIVNSIDAMQDAPADQRRIQVETCAAGDFMQIRFRDFGAGIPQEMSTRIFTLGYTTKATGHGFGLHSSANYMREMGGSLELAQPQPDGGAAFVLQLKRVQPARETVARI